MCRSDTAVTQQSFSKTLRDPVEIGITHDMAKIPSSERSRWSLKIGHPLVSGAYPVPGGVNFSIYSSSATKCTLVLHALGTREPIAELPFPPEFRIGHMFAMVVEGLEPGTFEYGFRFDGPSDPKAPHYFDCSKILIDPYARGLTGRNEWRACEDGLTGIMGRMEPLLFDWGNDTRVRFAKEDLVIYEMHLRGFTKHPSSEVKHAGTYDGLCEKIPYLKSIGVNCVELLPVFEFDECENTRTNPLTGEQLCNYWGYSTTGFFAPKAGYAAGGMEFGEAVEFKRMVKALHAAGIAVVLDVVYNHTAEGGKDGPLLSFRGIDNQTYYIHTPDGEYANYSGCGNSVNANHPVVRTFIRDSLRYWASEFHVDGFRFDLASALTRDASGNPLPSPPLIEELAADPVLADCILIAEAWDAGGLYQVGHFPDYGRWLEWNGKFRDAARRFIKGDPGLSGEIVQRIMGSPDLYKKVGRSPAASINFINCHDGFTLRDLFSYNEKHNLENGESNRDGSNDNWSWNCGVEGKTTDPEILALRDRMQKNALALLFLSQGIPMINMGDECGRTLHGNNNAYCHDEEWNWLDWSLPEAFSGLHRFFKLLASFRAEHPVFRQSTFLTGADQLGSGYADISWHGVDAWNPDWSFASRTVAFLLCGRHSRAIGGKPWFFYVCFNMFHEPLEFELPTLPKKLRWHEFLDTGKPSPLDIQDPGSEIPLLNQKTIYPIARSAVVLVGK
ncbi:MAG: glycogen debranching protein [Chthoniobacterales bacterium]